MTNKKTVVKSNGLTFETWSGQADRDEMVERIRLYPDRNKQAFANVPTNCYGNGYLHETVCTPETSKKAHIGKQGQADLQLYIPDCPNPKCGFNARIECKFGGADISEELLHYTETGKTLSNYIVFGANNYYGADKDTFFAPVIVETETFFRYLSENGLIRFHKSNGKNRGGEKYACIQVNKKAIQILLESATLYSPFHKFTHSEITGAVEWKPTEADYNFWKRYTFIFQK